MRSISLVLFVILPLASGRAFLGPNAVVDPASIQAMLQDMVGRGQGFDLSRLETIKAVLAPLFNAVPQSRQDRVATPFMKYMVQRYFSQQFGWMVMGFEPHASKQEAPGNSGEHILQSKAPSYVDSVVQNMHARDGWALRDVVVVAASIERLIFDEVVDGTETVYTLNSLPAGPIGSKEALMDLLFSYFIVEHLEGNSTNATMHDYEKKNVAQYYPHWPKTRDFIEDIVGTDAYQRVHARNPFRSVTYTFEDVTRINSVISEHFGVFSNHECHDMKAKLAGMDVYTTGRVKLADFYKAATGGAWQFLEGVERLRSVGALDNSSASLGPQVIVANYITGMNNCLTSSLFYSVCCLNECDGIFQHLEARIGTPTASAGEIQRAIEEGITLRPPLSVSAPVEARNLSAVLLARLDEIAAHHNDAIPLHGRLLAQWLHYVFPHECPFPYMSGTIQPKTSSTDSSVTKDELIEHIQSEVGRREPSPTAGEGMWTLQEELLGSSEHAQGGSKLRSAVQISMIVGVAVLVGIELRSVAQKFGGGSQKEKCAVVYNV